MGHDEFDAEINALLEEWDEQITKAKVFRYEFSEMPFERFEKSDEKMILLGYAFNHFCYKFGVNAKTDKKGCKNMKILYGNYPFFKIEPTNNRDYITYGDIFIQSDKQMAVFLDNIIKRYKLENVDYKELMCSHNFLNMIDKRINANDNQFDFRYNDEKEELDYLIVNDIIKDYTEYENKCRDCKIKSVEKKLIEFSNKL